MGMLFTFIRRSTPAPILRTLKRLTRRPRAGHVDFGHLRSLKPLSRDWGFDRGLPIDRYYIEQFISKQRAVIRGRVLEIADDEYTRRFGGTSVAMSDVLHNRPGNPKATIVADLTSAEHVASDSFDCIICTQTLQLIFDLDAAIDTLFRLLKPGATLLATVPTITKISAEDMDTTGDFWRFTSATVKRLFESRFPADKLEVGAHGNVLAAIGFLHGIAAEELTTEELNCVDRDFETLITIRAVKPGPTLFDRSAAPY